MAKYVIHGDEDTDALQAVAKKRGMDKSVDSYYGKRTNEMNLWPGDYHKAYPAWYCDLLLKEFKEVPCTDHPRIINNSDGVPHLVLEPYGADMPDMKELIEFCEARDLSFKMDGDSAYFPGRCLRIIIYENKR